MNKNGLLESRERTKFVAQAKAMKPGDKIYFFDKTNTKSYIVIEKAQNGQLVVTASGAHPGVPSRAALGL